MKDFRTILFRSTLVEWTLSVKYSMALAGQEATIHAAIAGTNTNTKKGKAKREKSVRQRILVFENLQGEWKNGAVLQATRK